MTTKDEAISWYQDIYNNPKYGMGRERQDFAAMCLALVPRGTYLDVGCGRGEMLTEAKLIGFEHPVGCDVSWPIINDDERIEYGEAQDIPFGDNEIDVVTLFDVLEHIPFDDIDLVLSELNRVAKKTILLAVSNRPSIVDGRDLHITKMEYDAWDRLFRYSFDGVVTWIDNAKESVSEMWRIDLN